METQPGPPVKRSKPDYNDTISVLVGPEEKRFLVHKELFCSGKWSSSANPQAFSDHA